MNTQHNINAGLAAALQHVLVESGPRYAAASNALLALGAMLHEHQQREEILGGRIVAGELWPETTTHAAPTELGRDAR